ncbi:lipopolysaccharide assembly protein LapA domain-containing protein [Nocardioides sp. CER19]|uniref:lipopolysaccharide assembly protein LapA domain-containing protein n=1 Tax=Nocardioides sp. CER19 TaxID=3038538 RepID=UPI00244B1262|nr:lipopolysaccharide assembly protein LapA domain-containing protein [Nocardioides sp. CER19]MDH2414590.1 lipopolysaccharide assembly protein LapA domain-containing protein [Nocardioides sp. CER19]
MTEPNAPETRDAPGTRGVDPGVDPDMTTTQPQRGHDPLKATRTGRAWVGVVALGVVLVLLIVFIAQNTRSVTVSFLGWNGQTSLAVALLIAAVAGLFLAAVAGSLRILQLRTRVRRDQKRRA